MSNKPNVMFIVVDQMRADCVHGALADHVQLPNIQALRKEAVTFTNHFGVTSPCGPARASLLTGLYAMNHRSVRNGVPLASDIPNVALQARQAGYEPMLFGYTDTSQDPRDFHANDPDLTHEEQVMPGFHELLEMRAQLSMPWRAHLKSKGYTLPDYADFYNPAPVTGQPTRVTDPAFYTAQDSDTAFLTDQLLNYLAVRTDPGWFALATYIRPHPPLVAPAPYNTLYDPAALPLPARPPTLADEAAIHPFLAGALEKPALNDTVRGITNPLDAANDADVQALRAVYLGLATEVDAHIGRIIQFLKDSGQYDSTILIFTSDHGVCLGDHHMWGKLNPYDASYRVPLVIRDPRQPDQYGHIVDAFTESTDLMPTLLTLIDAPVPHSLNGVSLTPFLAGKPPTIWRDAVHMELDFGEPDHMTPKQQATGTQFHTSNLAILREARFKLVHFNGGLAPLLYDLQSDPDELHNLADDPAHAATLLRLTQKLLSHRMQHADNRLSDMRVGRGGVVQFQQ